MGFVFRGALLINFTIKFVYFFIIKKYYLVSLYMLFKLDFIFIYCLFNCKICKFRVLCYSKFKEIVKKL